MFDGGLLGSFLGRMILLAVLIVIGLGFSGFLTFITHARKGLPLTTQTNRVTGVREAGLFRWFFTFAAIFAGPWVLVAVAVAGTHYVLKAAAWVSSHAWALLILAVGAAIVGAFVLLIRREPRGDMSSTYRVDMSPTYSEQTPAPAVVADAGVGWSLPPLEGHWQD